MAEQVTMPAGAKLNGGPGFPFPTKETNQRQAILATALIIFGVCSILTGAVLFFQPKAAVRLLARMNPGVLFLVDTDRRAVALTIDDAPCPEVTPGILERLQRHDAHATFFVIGSQVAGNEDLLGRIRAEGHEIGNHMMHDRPSIFLRPAVFADDLAGVNALLGETPHPRWFRPASGWFSRSMLDEVDRQGGRCCLGSVFPHDNKLRKPRWIGKYVLSKVFPGAIIILHDGGPHRLYTLEVLDIILPRLKARGYQVMTVTELTRLTASGSGPHQRQA